MHKLVVKLDRAGAGKHVSVEETNGSVDPSCRQGEPPGDPATNHSASPLSRAHGAQDEEGGASRGDGPVAWTNRSTSPSSRIMGREVPGPFPFRPAHHGRARSDARHRDAVRWGRDLRRHPCDRRAVRRAAQGFLERSQREGGRVESRGTHRRRANRSPSRQAVSVLVGDESARAAGPRARRSLRRPRASSASEPAARSANRRRGHTDPPCRAAGADESRDRGAGEGRLSCSDLENVSHLEYGAWRRGRRRAGRRSASRPTDRRAGGAGVRDPRGSAAGSKAPAAARRQELGTPTRSAEAKRAEEQAQRARRGGRSAPARVERGARRGTCRRGGWQAERRLADARRELRNASAAGGGRSRAPAPRQPSWPRIEDYA